MNRPKLAETHPDTHEYLSYGDVVELTKADPTYRPTDHGWQELQDASGFARAKN